jgi:hypothetical protein
MSSNRIAIPFIITLLIISMFSTNKVCAWTINANFESGTNQTKAQGLSGFQNAGTATFFTSDNHAKGLKSAKILWTQGSDGWGVGHGAFFYPQHVTDGQEVWARGYYYFASPWSFKSTPVSKILRIHIANSSGTNVGYHSILAGGDVNAWDSILKKTSSTLGYIVANNEVSPNQPNTGVMLDIDKWQCLEIYVKLSMISPITRIWKNGELIYEDTKYATISSSTDYADFSYIMTYWNGGAPQNQTEYVDEFIITTDKPSKIDSNGNPMIGPIIMPPRQK